MHDHKPIVETNRLTKFFNGKQVFWIKLLIILSIAVITWDFHFYCVVL